MNWVANRTCLGPNPDVLRCVIAALVLVTAGCGPQPLAPFDLATAADPVIGGMPASTCQWPTAVRIEGCTATLVHPKLVTLAAHCLEGSDVPKEVLFGEDARRPERRVAIETCKGYPDFVVGKSDIAYCILASEVRDVPPTPIIMGCETDYLKVGSALTLVGFGDTSASAPETSDTKRWADVVILRGVSAGESIEVGMGAATTCLGDSGGPLYAKVSDGTFRAVGAASLTRLIDAECAPPAYYTLLHKFIGWMETSSGLDLTPCHDADGTWNPGPDCGGFATAADRSNGAWADGCNAGAVNGPSATCREDLDGGRDAPAEAQAAPAESGTDAGGCACRAASSCRTRSFPRGATSEWWTSMLAFAWMRRFLRRRDRRSPFGVS